MSYYTPTISEFHVDFIYERVDESGFAMSQVMMATTSLLAIQQLLDEGSIRVKVLDEDDAEQLGFERYVYPLTLEAGRQKGLINIATEILLRFPGTQYQLAIRPELTTSYIRLYDVEMDAGVGPTHYSGECRNINELERILTRLFIHQPVQYASN